MLKIIRQTEQLKLKDKNQTQNLMYLKHFSAYMESKVYFFTKSAVK